MKTTITTVLIALTFGVQAQILGNVHFDQQNIRYQNHQAFTRQPLYQVGKKDVEFNLRIQYHALIREYIVTFGVSEEHGSVDTCTNRIIRRIHAFLDELEDFGIPKSKTFVDDITHHRVYEFQVEDAGYRHQIARENMVGFVIKKNVMIRYDSAAQLTEINRLAAKLGIYDLIKVDYKTEPIEDIMMSILPDMNEVVRKRQDFIRSTGQRKKFRDHEFSNIMVRQLQPVINYRSYTAQSTNRVDMTGYYYTNLTRISARKETTVYYQPEDASNFDVVAYGNENELIPTIIFEITVKITCRAR